MKLSERYCFSFVLFTFILAIPALAYSAEPFKVVSPFSPFPQESYSGIDYSGEYSSPINWREMDPETGTEKYHEIHFAGELWAMLRPSEGEEVRGKDWAVIQETLTKLNYKPLFEGDEKHIYVAKADDGSVNTYVEILSGWSYEYRIQVYQKRFLIPGKPQTFTFDPKKEQADKTYLHTQFSGDRYYTASLEVLDGEGVSLYFWVNLAGEIEVRDERSYNCDGRYYRTYRFYGLPPYKGEHCFGIVAPGTKTTVRLTITDTGLSVPPLGELTRKAAMLRLKNSMSSLPEVQSICYINGDFKATGDYLPSGDAIYWLNNGYYNLIKDDLRTNLVPLKENHQTTVDWPGFYDKIDHRLNMRAQTKIAVYDVKELEDEKVKVDFSISNLPKGLTITKDEFTYFEAGTVKGEVLSVEKLYEPMNVVILVDTSYSMVESMQTALDSVESFVRKLPEDANITIVDFDHKVKPVATTGRDDLITKLRKFRADGSTALYDSVIKGLELVKDKSRASIILFTDGKDANYNDTKRGSVATFDQMVGKIQENKIPIYPVAFGDKADTTTLNAIARMTKTTYYKGNDGKSLNTIFDEIGASLSSAYSLIAKRGKVPKEGSSPVVNYMVDVSGSMDMRSTMQPDAPEVANRFEPLKHMIAESIKALPEKYYVQLASFASQVKTHQIPTRDKARLLAGIGSLEAGGGTAVLDALNVGLELCKVVATNQRYFIFVTDAAGESFEFDEDDEKELKSALMAFKNARIQTFWLGMYDEPQARKAIERLATISGGESFISNDIEAVKEKILAVTKKISQVTDVEDNVGVMTIRLKIRDESDGSIAVALGQKDVDFKLLRNTQKIDTVSEIDYVLTKMDADKVSYNYDNARRIYGNDLPMKDVRVQKIIPLLDDKDTPVSGANNGISISLSKAMVFSRIKGVEASHGSKYLVLDTAMTNILKPQKVVVLNDGSNHPGGWVGSSNGNYTTKDAIPHYKIPNLQSHLFVKVNGGNQTPFHPITWVLGQPLTEVDDYDLVVSPQEPTEGVLAFEIPDVPIKTLSLHYYDTSYGHIHLPIIGEMDKIQVAKSLTKLPESSPAKLGEAFDISVKSITYEDEISGIKAAEGAVFAVLDFNLISKVNALLNLNPGERFYLNIPGKVGSWQIPPHKVTERVPMGAVSDLSVAPGGQNHFALVFHIPKALKGALGSILIELKGDDVELSLKPLALTDLNTQWTNVPEGSLCQVAGDKIQIAINRIHRVSHVDGYSNPGIIVDGTLIDEKDFTSTRISSVLAISNTPTPNFHGRSLGVSENRASSKGLGGFASSKKETENSAIFTGMDPITDSRILGYEPVCLDGTKKRFIAYFQTDKQKSNEKLYLVSPIFTDLKYEFDLTKVTPLPENENWLMTKKVDAPKYSEVSNLTRLLEDARREKALRVRRRKIAAKARVAMDSPKELPQLIAPSTSVVTGASKVKGITSVEKAINALKSIQWVPSQRSHSVYGPEALFTQNWGTEFDMIHVVHDLIRARNTIVKSGFYGLTQKGRDRLKELAGLIPCTISEVPYLSWEEEDATQTLVFPFLKSAKDLVELVDISKHSANDPLNKSNVSISMVLWWKKERATTGLQMGAMGGALSGTTNDDIEHNEIFRQYFKHHYIGEMAVDLWFAEGKDTSGKGNVTICHTSDEGTKMHPFTFEKGCIPKRLEITVHDGEATLEPLVITFKEGQKLSDYFFTISSGAPDLTEAAIKTMSDNGGTRLKNVTNLEPLSLAQWANRKKIYTFIGANTRYERELEIATNVTVKHNKTIRTIIATLQKTRDSKFISSLDLRQTNPDVYGDEKMTGAFNLMSGLMATEAEGKSVGNKGESVNVISLWKSVKDLKILTLLPNHRWDDVALFKKQELPERIIERLNYSQKIWLFPGQPVDGHYGWLEIDPETYVLTSVLDTGENGSMTESIITMENIETTTRYFLGLIVGTNISVGSVINYALQEEDYEAIKKRSQAMAKLLGCYVKKFESAAGKVKGLAENPGDAAKGAAKDAAKGDVPGGFDFSCDDLEDDEGDMPKKYSDLINFGKGIDHAIAAYFASMP
jgi:Mg-chelatase subunit ChlD